MPDDLPTTQSIEAAIGILRTKLARGLERDALVSPRVLDFVARATVPIEADRERLSQLRNGMQIAEVLLAIDADDETIAAALMVGGMAKKEIDIAIIKELFGADVAALVSGFARAGKIEAVATNNSGAGNPANTDAIGIEALRKMLLAMADDVRVVLIKLAERVVYMRSITQAAETIRAAAARHTRSLFVPLANRLGIFAIKWELEDLSFRFLEPEVYKNIAAMLDGKRIEREAFIGRVLNTLREDLARLNIKAEIAGRPKHIWSIHRKMQSKSLPFENLYDIRAVRVLVESVDDCYNVLALIHDEWKPITGEFDDYIAQPKANNYQSLHTAVIGPEGKTLEVQIRTHEMHNASEHGVAAHWRYKEGAGLKTAADKRFESKIAWLRQVLDWKRELADESGFSEQIKQGLFNDTVYVFTPQGKVIDLTAGSTPVDFAYHVHTDLGHRCRGAKLDGQIVPLNTKLQNAQRVEILAAKQGGPSRDWLNPQLGFLASPRAIAKVRNWFRQEYFEVDVAHGRQTLDRELARNSASSLALEKISTALNHKDLNECLAEIGRGEITAHQIEIALRGLVADASPPNGGLHRNTAPVLGFEALPIAPDNTKSEHKSAGGVLMLGVNNIATLVAKCCKPMPPDAIVGFVTRTRGVMVHRLDCANIVSLSTEQRDRLMPAQWSAGMGDTNGQKFAADIEVIANDRQGLLRDISEALSHERINVTAVNTISKANMASMRFTVEIQRTDQLQKVLRAVSEVEGVESVRRR
jgi:GTP pyrophosphokinase